MPKGRGAQPSGGSRSRNVLVTAAAVSLLGDLYGDRFQTLVLAGAPERLATGAAACKTGLASAAKTWPNSGVVLFERADALIERADRLEEQGELPFIVVDAAERAVETAILQFPRGWSFAADPQELAYEEELLEPIGDSGGAWATCSAVSQRLSRRPLVRWRRHPPTGLGINRRHQCAQAGGQGLPWWCLWWMCSKAAPR